MSEPDTAIEEILGRFHEEIDMAWSEVTDKFRTVQEYSVAQKHITAKAKLAIREMIIEELEKVKDFSILVDEKYTVSMLEDRLKELERNKQ